ncbi:hypothetical protein B566_EDAN005362 [Ephemera danica]|nr:hypothetical protein B566_EDAN005362 [Ephemera danica]
MSKAGAFFIALFYFLRIECLAVDDGALKPQFANSPQIESLSKHFVMVNAGDNEEPQDKKYAPDGTYIPRIYFLDSSGEVQEDIYNEEGNANYKYYYFNTESIIESMKKAVKKLANKNPQDEL